MTGLLEGPEHRNDRVAEEVSGVFSASPFSPMTQPADDGRTSRRSSHVRLGRPRQPREATRCRVSPHLLVPTDLAHARSPIAHWAAQNPLRTGRSANGSPVSTPRSKGWLQKTTKLLSENVNSKPPAKGTSDATPPDDPAGRPPDLARHRWPQRDSRQEPSQHHTHVQQVAGG